MTKKMSLFVWIVGGIFLAGCTPPAFRSHPDLQSRIHEMRSAAILPPDVKIYELSAGGVRDLRDDWCAAGRANMVGAIKSSFEEKLGEVHVVEVGNDIVEEVEDIYALYRVVSQSIILHTYNGQFRFPQKMKQFEYSLGPINPLLEHFKTDGLIFIYGMDEISTGGRKALQAFAFVAGVITGVMVVPRSGITAVSVALVDKTGDILWYSMQAREGSQDLRKAENCTDFLGQVLTDFPRFGQ